MKNNEFKDFYTIFKEYAAADPSRILISVDNQEISTGEFVSSVDEIAGGLAAFGITPDQRVGMILPNSVMWYTIFWAIVRTGARPVPLDPQIGEWEIQKLIELLDVELCFIAPVYRANNIAASISNVHKKLDCLKSIVSITPGNYDIPVLSLEMIKCRADKSQILPLHPINESDSLMFACTSGTTGNSRVINVPYYGFYKSQADMAQYLGFCKKDIMLAGMPLYHQGGFGMGLQMVLAGGTVIYQTSFDPVKFLDTLSQKKITIVQLTATLAKIILSVPDFDTYDLSSVKLAYFAGELLPFQVAREFFEKLKIRVVNIIGSSETATMVIWDSDFDIGCDVNDFRPLPFTKIALLDSDQKDVKVNETGIIHIHTDALLKEYYGNETETRARLYTIDNTRWFNTGDIGIKLEDGRVRFAGRVKRIIKRGSNLVHPEEIESFLMTHPDIEAVAVTGEKHDLFGEMIVAHLQLKQGSELTRGDIVNFCKGKLSAFKIPDQVIIKETIPHDTGKVQFKYLNKRNEE